MLHIWRKSHQIKSYFSFSLFVATSTFYIQEAGLCSTQSNDNRIERDLRDFFWSSTWSVSEYNLFYDISLNLVQEIPPSSGKNFSNEVYILCDVIHLLLTSNIFFPSFEKKRIVCTWILDYRGILRRIRIKNCTSF